MDLRRLTPSDAAAYRALMLRAYAEAPHAFTATVREREPLPLDWWRARVSGDPDADQRVLGAFDGGALVGVAGLRFHQRPRTRHKATLFGMYTAPSHRGGGLGRRLVEVVIADARGMPGVCVLQLTVREPNVSARRLYEACGFEAFGTEPLSIRDDEGFISTVHMWREV